MNEAQSAAGTGEAEQTTQPTESEQKPMSPLRAELRRQMGLEAPPVLRPQGEPPEEPKAEAIEEQPTETAAEETVPAEESPAEIAAEAPAPVEDEGEEVPDNWPKTAKVRIAEESRKRRERTEELAKWKSTAEQLYNQLQQATTKQLEPSLKLDEVVDKQSLATAEKHWKEIRRFARTHPDGADDVLVGKDADGNEIRRDYTREECIQMSLDADEAFELLPAKRAFIAESEANTAVAKRVYPHLFKDTAEGRQAAEIVKNNPWILRDPEWALWIGDGLAGRRARLAKHGTPAKGTAALSPQAQALITAPKIAAAPGLIKSRSGGAGGGPGREFGAAGKVDKQKLDDEFYAAGGTSEALEKKIKAKLEAGRAARQQGGRQAALV